LVSPSVSGFARPNLFHRRVAPKRDDIGFTRPHNW
jgi:hypothetical protein